MGIAIDLYCMETTMSDKYFAIGSIGTFRPNEEVTGLDDERMDELVLLGKVRVEQVEDDEDQTKPLTKMTVKELQDYIANNGGEFSSDDQKADLLLIAQGIEAELADNEE